MIKPPDILVVALGAANPDLLQEWGREGLLPNFQRLCDRGVFGLHDGECGLTAAAWGSLFTGLSVSNHGLVSYDQIMPGTYRSAAISDVKVRGEPFWETMSAAGKRVAIIDSPLVEPSQINGEHLVDWGTHDIGQYQPCRSWPKTLAADVMARYPADPFNVDDWGNSSGVDYPRHLAALQANLERKVALTLDTLGKERWNTVFVTFDECHQLGHLAWSLHDTSHPQHNPAQRAKLGDPLKGAYVALDQALGSVLDRIPTETFVLVLSVDGIGPNYSWSHLLDSLLSRFDQTEGELKGDKDTDGLYQHLARLWGRLPHHLQRPLLSIKNGMRERLLAFQRRRRKAFALPLNENFGAVRINLKGREPNGLVAPGYDYDKFCDELMAKLSVIVDVDRGMPLVRGMTKTAERFRGPFVSHLPDILIEWDNSHPIRRVRSPDIGTVQRSFENVRTGQHQAGGLFVATWQGCKPVRLSKPVSITDFAPTLVLRAGIMNQGRCDGTAIRALIN